jgi:formylmethanofuran dehydrogenase subunit A
MTTAIRITGGKLHDPANGVAGEVRDVLIVDGQVVSQLPAGVQPSVIDARGQVVMPGGVEMHSHLASFAVNAARGIQSAAGYDEVVPSAPQTGRLYAQLGYTTGIEPAVPPVSANIAHRQLDALPNLDTGILVLLGNHEAVIERLEQGDRSGAKAVVQQILAATGAYGIKAVNPAAVAIWRRDPAKHHIESIDDTPTMPLRSKLSPRAMLELLTEAQEDLGLAHPTHIHGPQLGEPGNVAITLEMLKALKGRRMHLAHLQYYCYTKTKRGGFKTAVDEMLRYLADHREVTADLGAVAFGPAFTATADLPLEHALYRHVGASTKPAVFSESGNEDCFGIMPLMHTPRSPSHAIQWATGLELALKWDEPWQFALTLDHPNGGSFTNYPTLIAQLMHKPLRDEQLSQCHRHATQRTDLAGVSREMSLQDIAIITRAAPAKALGLKHKGHLGVGADGDVTIYRDNAADAKAMFEAPVHVLKGGAFVVRDGAYVGDVTGTRITADVQRNDAGEAALNDWLEQRGTVSASQYLASV